MSQPYSEQDNPYAPPAYNPAAAAEQRLVFDRRPAGFVRYLVLAALCAAALIAYVQRNSIGAAEESIREELHLTKKQTGAVMSAFFLTYALLQLPTGWLSKVCGTRRALPIFSLLFSAAAAAFALAGGLPLLIATRLGMGGFQSGIFPCAVTTISQWTPPARRTFATGLLTSSMSVGGSLGGALTGLLLPLIGWRWAFAAYSIPGFLFAAAFYYWFRDRPEEHAGVSPAELHYIRGSNSPQELAALDAQHASDKREPTPWVAILTSLPLWALCGQQVFRAAGYVFFSTWFTTYLRETRGVKDVEAGLLTSLPLLAVVVASPLGGWLCDVILIRTGSRRLSRQAVSAVCMVACCLMILAAYGVSNAWLAVLLISAGSFFSAIAGPIAYTATIDLGGRHVAIVFSLMNMLGNAGAFVFPFLVPFLIVKGETPKSENWDLVLFVFAAMHLFAAGLWCLADTRRAIGSLPNHSQGA